MRIWLVFLFLTFQVTVYAFQSNKQTLLNRAEEFQYSNPDSAYILAEKIFKIASEDQDSIFLGESRRLLGAYFQLRGQLDSAIFYFEQSPALIIKSYEGNIKPVKRLYILGEVIYFKQKKMKKIISLLLMVLSLAVISCSDEFEIPNSQVDGLGENSLEGFIHEVDTTYKPDPYPVYPVYPPQQ